MRKQRWKVGFGRLTSHEAGQNAMNADQSAYYTAGENTYRRYKNPRVAENPLPEALNTFALAAEYGCDDNTATQTARAYALNGQYPQAEKILSSVCLDTASPEAVVRFWEVKAFLAIRNNCLDAAQEYLGNAMQSGQPWRRAGLHYAAAAVDFLMARQQGSFRLGMHAVGHLAAGVASIPDGDGLADFWPEMLCRFTKATARFRKADTLLTTYYNLYQRFPGSDSLPVAIGNLYADAGKTAEAGFWFQRAIERHPNNDDAYKSLVNLYQTTGNVEGCIDTLKTWLTIRPNHGELLLALSQALSNIPEAYGDALHYCRESLLADLSPSLRAAAYAHLGRLYSQSGDTLDSAVTAYQAAVDLMPGNLELYVQFGTLCYEKGDYPLSRRVFEKALAISPDNARILCNLGYLTWMIGDINASLDYYQRSVANDSGYDIALNNLGVLYLDHVGDIATAMDYFERTLAVNPNYALCHYNKGRAYSFLGDTIEAARSFRLAQSFNQELCELDDRELSDRIHDLFQNSPEALRAAESKRESEKHDGSCT